MLPGSFSFPDTFPLCTAKKAELPMIIPRQLGHLFHEDPSLSVPSSQRVWLYQECYVLFSFYQMEELMSNYISNLNGNHKFML